MSRLVFGTDHLADDLYRNFFDQAVEGIFRTSLDGHYLAANPALARLYGYSSPEALMGRVTNIAQQLYVDPRRREAFRNELAAADEVLGFESEIRRRDGSTIWISENARAVRNSAGEVAYYEGTVLDITDRRAAEEALRLALLDAERANRAKTAFLAAISHELKTPLNVIIGLAGVIEDEIFGAHLDKRYKASASDIRAGGLQLFTMINDVLELARLEADTIVLDEDTVDVSEVVGTAIRLTADAPSAVDVQLGPALPPLRADAKRVQQILVHLLSNAIKFTPAGGKIVLSGTITPGRSLTLTIEDTGIGIDPSEVAAALEPFKQLDGALSRRFAGLGLGLPIANSLVLLHGGTMRLEGRPGVGTTVTVQFPPERTIS